MKMIVGLGNPDKEYENTRHNVGFMIIDNFLGEVLWKKEFEALIYKSENVLFVKPITYMNFSGKSVRKILDYFKIDMQDMLIISDDLDQELGNYKIKITSGSGGHNGINSIIENLGTKCFNRLKIGISNNKNWDTKDYVLGKFSKSELDVLENLMPKINEIINTFIKDGIQKTLNTYKIGEKE